MLAEESSQGSLFGGPQRDDINLDSHQQLTQALNRLGIPVPDSTRNWKLQPLAAQYPVIETLLEYRTVQKALTSYGQNMIELINPVTKRLHADFRQIGAPTGSFACTNPNIQQVPHAVEYRRCFSGHPDGRKLIIADYSQIELRILAEFSGDRGFMRRVQFGRRSSSRYGVASFQCFARPGFKGATRFCQATELRRGLRHRRAAFAMMTGLSVSEAENVLRKYFATYRRLDTYLREAANRAVSDDRHAPLRDVWFVFVMTKTIGNRFR